MSAVEVSFRRGAPAETVADTRAVAVFEGEEPYDAAVRELVETGEAKAAPRHVAVAHEAVPGGDGRRRVIAVGLGKRGELDAERGRVAAAAAAKRAVELGARSLSWGLPAGADRAGEDVTDAVDRRGRVAAALVEGTLLALYRFDRFKSSGGSDDEDGDGGRIESLEVSADDDVDADVRRGAVVARTQNAARDLQNLPANVATPEYLAEQAAAVADRHQAVRFEALDREAIVGSGMGAFAAVAQGSAVEPRLIVLRYEAPGTPADAPLLALVGKAVTFDTGGISIKPAAKMHEMKFDMSGGAAVLQALDAVAELGLPGRILAVVPATENMPSDRSVKPGDIVTAMNGKTIEVNNTDAEGRLILADALCYAVREGADRIVDLATLTGAIISALGSTYAGLFANDDEWFAEVHAACEATGEIGWRMPLHPEIFELTKGRYADLTNASEQRKAMSSYAAEFLRQFVDDRPWVHLDIAGTAWGMTRPYVGNGASGFGVRLLVELVRRVGG